MQEYDIALKRILTRPGSTLLRVLTGFTELKWLNVELPQTSNLRVDLLGAAPDGRLIQIEFQSRNKARFAQRMHKYLVLIEERYRKYPKQIVLYLGGDPCRLKSKLSEEDLDYKFHLLDVRDLDSEALMASTNLSDNVVAILTRLSEQPGAVRQILMKIMDGPEEERDEALTEIALLAGLRRLRDEVAREKEVMPIEEDIMDNWIIGPMIRRREAQASAQGMMQGQLDMLVRLIRKRFGRVTPRIRAKLNALQPDEITSACLRILDAERVDDIFAQ